MRSKRSAGAGLVLLALLAGPALAQVPQYETFRGRLLDASGTPQTGPVNLELRLFDVETGGTAIYAESYTGVPLDVTGGFAVQFGLGTPLMAPPAGGAAALFSAVPRWFEVKVGTEVLTPRVRIGSAPWALVAQQASKIVPDPTAPRFEDCGDDTVADHQTGLQWEKKTTTTGPHNVENTYQWSATSTAPDGAAFTDFLAKLNDPVFGTALTSSDVTGCFAGHCDWRLPNIVELKTILNCANSPCIDPIFGSTAPSFYWSASTHDDPNSAWFASFSSNLVDLYGKTNFIYVRAVRAGSC